MEKSFVCECGYDFENMEGWNCWNLVGEIVKCPLCSIKYQVCTDAIDIEENGESSDIWWLEKK